MWLKWVALFTKEDKISRESLEDSTNCRCDKVVSTKFSVLPLVKSLLPRPNDQAVNLLIDGLFWFTFHAADIWLLLGWVGRWARGRILWLVPLAFYLLVSISSSSILSFFVFSQPVLLQCLLWFLLTCLLSRSSRHSATTQCRCPPRKEQLFWKDSTSFQAIEAKQEILFAISKPSPPDFL